VFGDATLTTTSLYLDYGDPVRKHGGHAMPVHGCVASRRAAFLVRASRLR
jgi:hypothetical protein